MRAKGDSVTYEDVLANVCERDRIDTTRARVRCARPTNAVVLDNSNMTIAEQDKVAARSLQ